MIVRTEAVALRSVNYGETSQIVTLYTRRLGTVAVMARGARGAKSRFGSALQPMSHLQAVFYHKPSREVHSLSEASHVTVFRRIRREIDRLSLGLRIVETVNTLMSRPEANEQAFDIVLNVLARLDAEEGHWQNLLPYFQLQVSACLGFAPSIDKEQIEQITDAGGYVRLDDGGAQRTKPATPAMPSSRQAVRALGIMMHSDLDTIMRMNVAPEVHREVLAILETYLSYHVEDFRQSRSKRVFENMRSGLTRN
jgi:DNA repair protein RecO (recombination protein O)